MLYPIFLSLALISSCFLHADQRSFSADWYQHQVSHLAIPDQKKIARFLYTYHKAAYVDAQMRYQMVVLGELFTQLKNADSHQRYELLTKIAATLTHLKGSLLPEQQEWTAAWDQIGTALETETEEIRRAIDEIQAHGQEMILTSLSESQTKLHDEFKLQGEYLQEIAQRIEEYAPMYQRLFNSTLCETKTLTLAQDCDWALKMAGKLDGYAQTIEQTTASIKCFAVMLELKTSDFVRELFEQYDQDLQQEIISEYAHNQ